MQVIIFPINQRSISIFLLYFYFIFTFPLFIVIYFLLLFAFAEIDPTYSVLVDPNTVPGVSNEQNENGNNIICIKIIK
jgi:hypothetical protein